jgi:serine/threonine protein kinase
MLPEQARGEDLDVRTDLFSFGAVLYEMATGHMPFRGNTSAAILGAILHAAPSPVLQLNPQLPQKLEEIISRVLEKDRDLRYQSAADLRSELKRLKRDTDSGPSAGVSPDVAGASRPSKAEEGRGQDAHDPWAGCPRDSGRDPARPGQAVRATTLAASGSRRRHCRRGHPGLPPYATLAGAEGFGLRTAHPRR